MQFLEANRLIVLIVLFGAVPISSLANAPDGQVGTLVGTIFFTDEERGDFVENAAYVEIELERDGVTMTISSNVNGDFMYELPPGSYRLKSIVSESKQLLQVSPRQARCFEVRPGRDTRFDIMLLQKTQALWIHGIDQSTRYRRCRHCDSAGPRIKYVSHCGDRNSTRLIPDTRKCELPSTRAMVTSRTNGPIGEVSASYVFGANRRGRASAREKKGEFAFHRAADLIDAAARKGSAVVVQTHDGIDETTAPRGVSEKLCK